MVHGIHCQGVQRTCLCRPGGGCYLWEYCTLCWELSSCSLPLRASTPRGGHCSTWVHPRELLTTTHLSYSAAGLMYKDVRIASGTLQKVCEAVAAYALASNVHRLLPHAQLPQKACRPQPAGSRVRYICVAHATQRSGAMRCSCLTHICSLQDSQLSVTHDTVGLSAIAQGLRQNVCNLTPAQ